MRSITSSVIKLINKKLSFFASKFCLLFSNPQAATTHVDELSESHSEHKSIEVMRTSCSKMFATYVLVISFLKIFLMKVKNCIALYNAQLPENLQR